VDTSHYETRYRTVDKWVSCNKVFVTSHNSGFSWGYNITNLGNYTGMINGTRYKYKKYFYNYVALASPSFDYFKYQCYQELKTVTESYNVWVSSGYYTFVTAKDWIDTSHWETVAGRRWVDTSYTVHQGYWQDYTETIWVDTSHWEYQNVWVEDGFWAEIEMDPVGKVLHTDKWNQNRIQYNLAMTGEEDNPRGYEIFFNGEKFVLECYTSGDFDPKSVHVDFIGTEFFANLDHVEEGKWEGFIWDESFIYFHDRDCVFKFTATYEHEGETFELEDEVTVYIVRDEYWRLHRSY